MNSYKSSHSSIGYGDLYKKSYEDGYNFHQWELCEKILIKKVFSKLAKENDKYLDFACGTGRILKLSETIFSNSFGVDISDTMLQVAKSDTKKSVLINQDIVNKPIDKKFDVISSFRFFNNAEKSLSIDVLRSLHEMLRDDGTLVFNIHRNKEGLLSRIYNLRNIKPSACDAKFVSEVEIRELLSETGYELKDITYYSFLPKSSRYPNWFLRLFFNHIETQFSKLPLEKSKWAQCFIVIAKKSSS